MVDILHQQLTRKYFASEVKQKNKNELDLQGRQTDGDTEKDSGIRIYMHALGVRVRALCIVSVSTLYSIDMKLRWHNGIVKCVGVCMVYVVCLFVPMLRSVVFLFSYVKNKLHPMK